MVTPGLSRTSPAWAPVVPGIVAWVSATGGVNVGTTVPRTGVAVVLPGVETGRSFSHAASPTLSRARIVITTTSFKDFGMEASVAG